MYKLQQAAQQLQQLGWQQWQAALALNLCGALLPAATWLLEDAAASRVSCIADAQKLLSDAGNPISLPILVDSVFRRAGLLWRVTSLAV